VILCGLTVLQATCLVLWLAPDANKSRASIAAATLSLVDAVALCTLSHLEHIYSVTPSPVLNAYLILSLALDSARLRTAWMRGNSVPLAIAFSIASVIKLVSLLAEAIEKRAILLPPYSGYSPESTSGVYSRALFWWLNPLLSKGFRSILDPNDLYPVDVGLRTNEITHQLERVWARRKGRPSKHGFLWATIYTIRVPLAKAIVPRLCVSFFQYMQPFLISAVIKFLQESGTADSDRVGWALTGAYGLDFVGIAIANGVYMHQTYRMVTVSRAALISVIYSQTVDLNLSSVDESAAVTLMSTDVERISSAFQYIHGLWASPLDAIIGAYLLQRRIGLAAIGPALVSVSFGSVVLFVAIRYAPKAQRLWVGCIQARIDATSKMISGMKAVKILGLAPVMHRLIHSLREHEVKAALRFRRISVLRLSFGKGSEILAPGIAFAMYYGVRLSSGQPLDVDNAYASLNIITLMTIQLGETIQNLPTIMSAISCFDRIQDFLNLPSQKDQRLVKEVAPQANTTPSQERSSGESLELDQLSKAGVDPSTPVLSLRNVSLSWIKGDEIIKDVTFDVPPHTFCFIVGPAGCGKSTLLKGLVGEVTLSTGFVHSSSPEAGFVDQTPWIQNGTLQHNVLGTAMYEKHWYEAVLYACCLDDDVAAMPQGEHTQVGSVGTNLSGGQKQRLVGLMRFRRRSEDTHHLCRPWLEPCTRRRTYCSWTTVSAALIRRQKTV
jgi:ATP-binding cassette subfamily C (CFTR/MRP) protein 1